MSFTWQLMRASIIISQRSMADCIWGFQFSFLFFWGGEGSFTHIIGKRDGIIIFMIIFRKVSIHSLAKKSTLFFNPTSTHSHSHDIEGVHKSFCNFSKKFENFRGRGTFNLLNFPLQYATVLIYRKSNSSSVTKAMMLHVKCSVLGALCYVLCTC